MRDVVTSALEVAGMLLIAAAAGCATSQTWAWCVFFACAGVVLVSAGVFEGRK